MIVALLIFVYKHVFRHLECFNKTHPKINELKNKILKLYEKYPDFYKGVPNIPIYLGDKSYTLDKKNYFYVHKKKKMDQKEVSYTQITH